MTQVQHTPPCRVQALRSLGFLPIRMMQRRPPCNSAKTTGRFGGDKSIGSPFAKGCRMPASQPRRFPCPSMPEKDAGHPPISEKATPNDACIYYSGTWRKKTSQTSSSNPPQSPITTPFPLTRCCVATLKCAQPVVFKRHHLFSSPHRPFIQASTTLQIDGCPPQDRQAVPKSGA